MIISDIVCLALVMDKEEVLYVFDAERHDVRRYERSERKRVIVASEHEQGVGSYELKHH